MGKATYKPVVDPVNEKLGVAHYEFGIEDELRLSVIREIQDPTRFEAYRVRNAIWDHVFLAPYRRT